MASLQPIYINFTGGIVSPGYLKEVLEIAALHKVTNVKFGLRQQLSIEVLPTKRESFVAACAEKNILCFSKKEMTYNIVSSYPAVDIFTSDTWAREGVYKDIFNSFDYLPKLKINITDCQQTFVPFFTGHINWIASSTPHFWYLYIRFPKTESSWCLPELVYTNDIVTVSKMLEEVLARDNIMPWQQVYKHLKATYFIFKPIEHELQLARFSLPYYEGFNKYNNNYWLGIYRREEQFGVQFLLDICSICTKTRIGQIYTTPWKSIIIKGIEPGDRHLWDYVLGKYRINVRHAANELNWQVEDNCEDGLQIKRQIIRFFDKEDVRTYGLCFAVKTRPFSTMMGSVVIRKQEVKNPGKLKALERFEILYTEGFNPNVSTMVSFRKNIEKEHLGTYLVSLCKLFYEAESIPIDREAVHLIPESLPASGQTQMKIVYQCKHCFSVYDETAGDVENNIAAGTPFSSLPSTYCCPLCDSGLEDYETVTTPALELLQ